MWPAWHKLTWFIISTLYPHILVLVHVAGWCYSSFTASSFVNFYCNIGPGAHPWGTCYLRLSCPLQVIVVCVPQGPSIHFGGFCLLHRFNILSTSPLTWSKCHSVPWFVIWLPSKESGFLCISFVWLFGFSIIRHEAELHLIFHLCPPNWQKQNFTY